MNEIEIEIVDVETKWGEFYDVRLGGRTVLSTYDRLYAEQTLARLKLDCGR